MAVTPGFAFIVRFVNDILLSAPSILIGLFIYELIVARMGHFSAWAGAAALAVIVIPVVVRTTENMLLLVPNTLREAAAALGTPRSHCHPHGDLAGGAGRHHHRRAAGGRAHLRRNRAASVHRARQQFWIAPISTRRWRACRRVIFNFANSRL